MMKKYLMCLTIFMATYSYGQFVVEAPTLEAIMVKMGVQQLTATQLQLKESLLKQATGIVVSMESTTRFINTINTISCTAKDYDIALTVAKDYGFWNCWLDDQTNDVVATLMGAVDIANTAMNAFLETDPSNRIQMMKDATERYFRVEGKMRILIVFVERKIRKIDAAKRQKKELTDIARLMVQ